MKDEDAWKDRQIISRSDLVLHILLSYEVTYIDRPRHVNLTSEVQNDLTVQYSTRIMCPPHHEYYQYR